MIDYRRSAARIGAQRLGLIVAVLPLGVVLDRIGEHRAPHAVAADDRRRHRRERHPAIGHLRIPRRPHPRVHAAHRRPHHEAEVIDLQVLGDQLILQLHHVLIAVFRELHAQAVARLARLPVADVVGEDQEIFRGVEQLPGAA